jgi:hypothetical protein
MTMMSMMSTVPQQLNDWRNRNDSKVVEVDLKFLFKFSELMIKYIY